MYAEIREKKLSSPKVEFTEEVVCELENPEKQKTLSSTKYFINLVKNGNWLC